MVSSKNGLGKSHWLKSSKNAAWHFNNSLEYFEHMLLYIEDEVKKETTLFRTNTYSFVLYSKENNNMLISIVLHSWSNYK